MAEMYEQVQVGDPIVAGWGEVNWVSCFRAWEVDEVIFRCTRQFRHRGKRHVAEGLDTVRSVYEEEQ